MLKKLRKSSGTVTLVLIGAAAIAGCGGGDARRQVYASQEDCLADWGNTPQDCTPATDQRHAARGFFYGPSYHSRGLSSSGTSWGRSSGTFSSSRASGSSRSIGSTGSSSRGGFGSSGRSSSTS